jgi:2C-methyl-D-erythritol 2,4-cyclodiphosphate synthase
VLPFLKNKQQGIAGLIVKQRNPDKVEENQEDTSEDKDASIHACAQDLIDAVHAKDIKAAAEAIRSAFEILDSQPHEEGEHTSPEPHSYEAQNIKANKED